CRSEGTSSVRWRRETRGTSCRGTYRAFPTCCEDDLTKKVRLDKLGKVCTETKKPRRTPRPSCIRGTDREPSRAACPSSPRGVGPPPARRACPGRRPLPAAARGHRPSYTGAARDDLSSARADGGPAAWGRELCLPPGGAPRAAC